MTTKNNKPKLAKRVKNELKFRELTVKSKQKIAGCFCRIVLAGDQLTGFSSQGFDDHVKVFFPVGNEKCALPEITSEGIVWPDGPRPAARDYTPLSFDAALNELTIDFFIHEGGIASQWAESAKPGDKLMTGGPRGSLVVPVDYAWQLYVCDESGLPAVRRRLLSLPKDISVQVLVNCNQPQTQEYLSEFSQAHIEWLNSESVAEKLQSLSLPATDYYCWITGEGEEVKQLSESLLATHSLDADYLRAVAYWHKK
ncbi:siderophore-interacting protein [uncultured Cedecea sp.]|uniref:siderophore-interacting protein n=1 Tax=uncultured Cedecea sp. TaxID=988762 RepID=UPI00263384FF|nr:siderophore-interacting protein [uncultured Cedecea sp.]